MMSLIKEIETRAKEANEIFAGLGDEDKDIRLAKVNLINKIAKKGNGVYNLTTGSYGISDSLEISGKEITISKYRTNHDLHCDSYGSEYLNIEDLDKIWLSDLQDIIKKI